MRRSRRSPPIGSLGALSAVGIAFVLAVGHRRSASATCSTAGSGTSPLFVIVFFFLGVAAGIVNVVRTVNAVDRDEKR